MMPNKKVPLTRSSKMQLGMLVSKRLEVFVITKAFNRHALDFFNYVWTKEARISLNILTDK